MCPELQCCPTPGSNTPVPSGSTATLGTVLWEFTSSGSTRPEQCLPLELGNAAVRQLWEDLLGPAPQLDAGSRFWGSHTLWGETVINNHYKTKKRASHRPIYQQVEGTTDLESKEKILKGFQDGGGAWAGRGWGTWGGVREWEPFEPDPR